MGDRASLTQTQSTVRAAWESRSQKHGATIEGVMNKAFPLAINEVLHAWQLDHVLPLIPPAANLRLLDVGCGYGRVSHPLVHQRPQLQAIGMDLAHHYACLFARDGGNCGGIQSQVLQTPFSDAMFDFVIAVGVLGLITTRARRRQALKEMLRVLKPAGRFLLITEEPIGRKVWTLGGVLDIVWRLAGHGKGPENEAYVTLPLNVLREQITAAGGKITQQAGCPMLTLALLVLSSIALLSSDVAKSLAQACLRLDRWLGESPSPSIYTISVVTKG